MHTSNRVITWSRASSCDLRAAEESLDALLGGAAKPSCRTSCRANTLACSTSTPLVRALPDADRCSTLRMSWELPARPL